MVKIAILGCGNIGRSVAEGLINSDFITNNQLILTRRNENSLADLKAKGAITLSDNTEAVRNAKYIILGVKPYKVNDILDEIRPVLTENHVLISLASSVSIAEILNHLGKEFVCFRAMPNTAGAIQESLTCICHKGANKADEAYVKALFDQVGDTVVIEENLMEAATILGACGIAYALRFIRAMIQGGVQIGFSAEVASKITTQTVKGAAKLLQEKQTHPEAEIDKVTTPKGCTITGLNEMEHQGFSASLIKGIHTSFLLIDKSNEQK